MSVESDPQAEPAFTGYAAGTLEKPDVRGVPFPNGARVAVRMQLVLEEWDDTPMMKVPGTSKEVVDYREISVRNYGVRTGFHRLMDVMDEVGCKATVSTTGICGDKWPELVSYMVNKGHEVVAHGYSQAEQNSFMDEEEDYQTVLKAVSALEKASGVRPTGWASGAARRGAFTAKSLLRAGLRHTNDFREADVPFIAAQYGDLRLVAMPRTDEINDNYALHNVGHSPGNYTDYFKRTFDRLYKEGATKPGRVITAVAHSTVMGHAWGAEALGDCCRYALEHDDVWQATSSQIADNYLAGIDSL